MPRQTVSVAIEINDVLRDISNDVLVKELRRRRHATAVPPLSKVEMEEELHAFDTLMHDLREAFLTRDARHFNVVLERLEHRFRPDEMPATVGLFA